MQKLALDQALQAIFIARDQAESDFFSNLMREISKANDHTSLAETIVSLIGNFYDFPHVSIFKIDALRGYFSILAQNIGNGGAEIPKGYIQPIDVGLLGLTYRRGECVNLGDRSDGSEEAKVFKEACRWHDVAKRRRSFQARKLEMIQSKFLSRPRPMAPSS